MLTFPQKHVFLPLKDNCNSFSVSFLHELLKCSDIAKKKSDGGRDSKQSDNLTGSYWL